MAMGNIPMFTIPSRQLKMAAASFSPFNGYQLYCISQVTLKRHSIATQVILRTTFQARFKICNTDGRDYSRFHARLWNNMKTPIRTFRDLDEGLNI